MAIWLLAGKGGEAVSEYKVVIKGKNNIDWLQRSGDAWKLELGLTREQAQSVVDSLVGQGIPISLVQQEVYLAPTEKKACGACWHYYSEAQADQGRCRAGDPQPYHKEHRHGSLCVIEDEMRYERVSAKGLCGRWKPREWEEEKGEVAARKAGELPVCKECKSRELCGKGYVACPLLSARRTVAVGRLEVKP